MFAVRRLPAAVLRCRFTRWSALAMYVCLSCGFSAPIPSGKDLSRPFPCMHSRCGCHNADQCWRSCCCHSLDERVAWAQKHGVEPPAYVKTLARQQTAPAKKSCCSDQRSNELAKRSNCCSSHGAPGKCAAQHSDTPKGVSFLQAMRCRGLSANWIGMAPTVTSEQLECSIRLEVVEWLVPSHLVLSSRDLAPPIPPPRLVTA